MVPQDSIRSLHTLPQDISQKLPPDAPIHCLLAADLALDESCTSWSALLPTQSDFEASIPFMWPAELQAWLPSPALNIVVKQKEKFQQHWVMYHDCFPGKLWGKFLHAWFLVNTRTFYNETPETMRYPWEDRLALIPVADLFNHAETGCHVEYTPEYYSVTADRAYQAGDEMYISYGHHSNDFLLAEYGFILSENRWDRVSLDQVILPKLSKEAMGELERRELLGDYMISDPGGPCDRTRAALETLISYEKEELRRTLDQGKTDQSVGTISVEAKLKEISQELLMTAKESLDTVQRMQRGSAFQRSTLAMRWAQIIKVLEKFA